MGMSTTSLDSKKTLVLDVAHRYGRRGGRRAPAEAPGRPTDRARPARPPSSQADQRGELEARAGDGDARQGGGARVLRRRGHPLRERRLPAARRDARVLLREEPERAEADGAGTRSTPSLPTLPTLPTLPPSLTRSLTDSLSHSVAGRAEREPEGHLHPRPVRVPVLRRQVQPHHRPRDPLLARRRVEVRQPRRGAPHSLTHPLTHPLTHSLMNSLTHPLTRSLAH